MFRFKLYHSFDPSWSSLLGSLQPLFKNVIEALSYALFIFIVVLALLPNGYRILLTYGGILVWTQLWAPLYAVLNLIMTLYGKGETKSLIGTDLTLLNSSAVINANADMVTLAAWLSVSIPFISYGILKQGAAAFVGLAQHLGSAMQSAASGAAAETVSGNISLGNFTMGTQAYQNATAFQHNTSPNYNASQFKSLSAAGLETSTFAGGNQALTDQAISRLGIQIMGTENTSFATQESLNHASSLFRSTSIAANEATETAFQKTTQFLSQVSEAFSQGDERSQSLTASDAKSLQDFKNYVKDIQQRTGLSHAQAVEVGVAAKLGTPEILGFSLSGQGSFSSQATNQQDMASAQSIADQKNYTESLERILSAAESYSKARNNTALAELGKSATSNLNKAQSLLRETSVAKNQMDTLSKELSANQSQTLTITKDLTQPLLEFIASQPVNMGPGSARSFRGDEKSHSRMGMEGARRILEQGGPEFKAYMDRFQEENPQYKIQSIHYGQERRNLDQTYQKEALQIKEKSPLSQHHLDNVHKVAAQGKEKNLSLASLNAQQRASPILTQQMTTVFQQVDKTLNQRKEDLSTHEEHLQKEREILDKKTLGGAAVKNLLKSGGKGILNVIEDLPPAPPLIFP